MTILTRLKGSDGAWCDPCRQAFERVGIPGGHLAAAPRLQGAACRGVRGLSDDEDLIAEACRVQSQHE